MTANAAELVRIDKREDSNCQNAPWRGGMSRDWPPKGAIILPESMMVGPTNQLASIARRTSLIAYSALLPTSRSV
jgi:hypothetical protein